MLDVLRERKGKVVRQDCLIIGFVRNDQSSLVLKIDIVLLKQWISVVEADQVFDASAVCVEPLGACVAREKSDKRVVSAVQIPVAADLVPWSLDVAGFDEFVVDMGVVWCCL